MFSKFYDGLVVTVSGQQYAFVQIDILPVTIVGNNNILPDQGVFEGKPGHGYQIIHKPISTKGMTLENVDELKNQVYNVINNKLAEYNYGN
jgi:1-acyl-sn-glycerol-3-phosphate acyltransferase